MFTNLLAMIALALPALAADAPVVSDSPVGTYAIAKFPQGGLSDVSGYVKFTALSSGQVQVDVDVKGLPSAGYPFLYHIHTKPVPSNGSCLATAGHLNPFEAATPCVKSTPGACEIGDLSGKHSSFNTTSFSSSYVDPYLSLNSNDEAFIANSRSIVFHYGNTTRIACANLEYYSNSSSIPNNTTFTGAGATNKGMGLLGLSMMALAPVLL